MILKILEFIEAITIEDLFGIFCIVTGFVLLSMIVKKLRK